MFDAKKQEVDVNRWAKGVFRKALVILGSPQSSSEAELNFLVSSGNAGGGGG